MLQNTCMPTTGIEPVAFSLPWKCSTTELCGLDYSIDFYKRVMGFEPTYLAWKANILPLNYTRLFLEREGFEPSKAKPTDLQSVPVDHLGTSP